MARAAEFHTAFRCIALCAIALAAGAAPAAADDKRWQGFYVGVHAGLVTGSTQSDFPVPIDYTMTGALTGMQIGYNWQNGTQVFGIEGSVSHSSVQGSTVCDLDLNCKRDVNWLATVVGRYGLTFGNTLVYGMAGAAWADIDTDVSFMGMPFLTGSTTRVGWTGGFGIEHAFSSQLTARIEYAHIAFGSRTQDLIVCGCSATLPDRMDLTIDTIRLGVNLKLPD